jgi:CheY-like chemotaxis protein
VYEGTGLGLTIAKKMIKILGGDIKVKSKFGKGSKFTVILPIKWQSTDNQIIKKIQQKLAEKNIVRKKEKIKSDSDSHKVLVIEDNKDNMTTVKAILQKKYTIIEAYDGESGLKKALKHLPTIVLLDISLPKMDGIEVVKILKKTKETKNIPVIALTARAMKEDRDTFIKAGCDDYISKPVDSIILLNKIEEWI